MTTPTQMTINTEDIIYVSVFEKPNKCRGRPKSSTLTDAEKKQRAIEINRKYYYENHEYCKLQRTNTQLYIFRKPVMFILSVYIFILI